MVVTFKDIWSRSSAGLEQQPSKLWVVGSSPTEQANFIVGVVKMVNTTDLKSVASSLLVQVQSPTPIKEATM